jgi:WD40 repeat protein
MVWDAPSGRVVRTLQGEVQPPLYVTFSLDGKRLASYHHDFFNRGGFGGVKVWDLDTGRDVLSLPDQRQPAFLADGRTLATVGQRPGELPRVRLWELSTGREVGGYEARGVMGFSPDGRFLAAVPETVFGGGYTLEVRDAATGERLHTWEGQRSSPVGMAFSPDGKWLAGYGGAKWSNLYHQNEVPVWDLTAGRLAYLLRGHSDNVFAAAFSPDGRRLATVSRDQTVKLWDVPTGLEVLSLKGHGAPALDVAFDRDGRRLATGGADRTVKLWEAPPPSPGQGQE